MSLIALGTSLVFGPTAVAALTAQPAGASKSKAATWQPVGPTQISGSAHGATGGGAGKLQAFVVDLANPKVMYAGGGIGPGNSGPGSEAGVYMSTNGGSSWTQRDVGLSDTAIDVLWMDQSDSSVLLAGTWQTGIFRTSNGGSSWSVVASLGATSAIVAVGKDLYAGTQEGVARSSDNGKTWSVIEATPSAVRALAASGSTLWAGLDNGNVTTGTEPANTWTTVETDPGNTVWSIAADPTNASIAFIVEWDNYQINDLLGTTNGGATWTPAPIPYYGVGVQYVSYDVNTPGTIYAGADGGIFISTNNGSTWSPPIAVEDVRFLWSWPGRSRTVVSGGDQGLYLSTDGGQTWTGFNGNITSSILNDVVVSGDEILAPAQDYNPLESTDGGGTWAEVGSYCENGTAAISPGNPSYQYLFTTCGFFYSTDGGASFTQVEALADEHTFTSQNNAIAIDPNAPATVYVAGKSGVWKSTDSGVDFSLESSWPATSSNGASLIAVSPASSSDLFLGTMQGFYVTTDGGSVWTKATGLPADSVAALSIAVDPTNPNVVLVGGSGATELYRSTDGGLEFSPATSGLEVHSAPDSISAVLAISFEPGTSPSVVAAAGPSIGVALSSDDGTSWKSGLGNAVSEMFTGLAWSGEYLYASTFGEGILREADPVGNVSQKITFGKLAKRTLSQSPIVVSATASSGLTVTFTTTTPSVCSSGGTNGATITLLKAGTCTVQANQPGNATYRAATPVDRSFTVS
jgi:photosystem II stability/assembly factor-like uncharacterized protein